MSLETLVIMLFVAAVVGVLGQLLAGYSRGGLLGSIVLGFAGAVIGTWAARTFRLPIIYTLYTGGMAIPIVWAILGAALFVSFMGLASRRRYADD